MADALNPETRPSWRLMLPVLMPTLALILLLFLLFGSENAVKERFAAIRLDHPTLTACMTRFSKTGNIAVAVVYAALLGLGLWRRDAGLKAFVVGTAVSLILVAAAVSFCKMAVGRPRPLIGGAFQPFSSSNAYHSFPSGHVFEASSLSLPLSRRYGRLLLPIAAGCFVALMAFSRIYLGKHHPSDILGGLFFGVSVAVLAAKVEIWILARLRPAPSNTPEKH